MAQELEAGVHGEAELIEIATRLACEGYWQDIKQVMKVSRVFRYDEQLWDAMKDEPGTSAQKRTRLIYAAREGDLERLRFLLDRGARVNMGCVYGKTALMYASEGGHLEVVRELCKRGSSLNAVQADDGFSALMYASYRGHVEVVHELCTRGADVSSRAYLEEEGEEDMNAFMMACVKGHLGVFNYLCDLNPGFVSDTFKGGWTPLMYAVSSQSEEIICELLKRGANVNARATSTGQTALMVAGETSDVDMCILLLQHHADKNAQDLQGHNAYFHSTQARVDGFESYEAYYVTQGILTIIPPLE